VRGHVSAETLAAFREELLPRRKARRVAAHLARCAQCAGLDAQLAGLPALLAGTPVPPMPDALTARITAALAAEAAARSASSAAGAAGTELAGAGAATAAAAGGSGRGRHGRAPGRDRSRLTLRIAAATAAVAVAGGGGYGVLRLVSSTGTGPSRPAAAAGSPAHSVLPPSPVQRPAARQGSAFPSGGHSAASSEASSHVVASGTNYLPSELQAQVSAVLDHASSAPAPSASAPAQPAPNFGAIMTGCVARVTGGRRPLLVDHARYEGKPATIIVVQGTRPNTLRVLVAGAACSAGVTDLLASTTMPG
jgi:hypothetical protein